VLLVLVTLRTNLTERALAALLGVSQPTAHRAITALLPQIAALFDNTIPDTREHLLLDGTLIPVHDQSITARSKNYRRSINTQIVATCRKRVVFAGEAWPGNRNDMMVAKATTHPPARITFKADSAYRSLPDTITPPPRTEPKTRQRHIQTRARIEHVLARMKNWQILRQCQQKSDAINQALQAVAYLHNQRISPAT